MSKAILVIDMPKNCFHCKLQDWANCRILKGCHTGDTRPDWCPLKPLPDMDEEDYKTEWCQGVQNGWNNCIYEILGMR